MKRAPNTVSALLFLLTAAYAAAKTLLAKEESQDSYHICDSPVCLQRAQQIKKSLDLCVDPCDDFYSFACGGWFRRHTIPENRASLSAFDFVQNGLDESLRAILGNMTLVYDDNQNVTDKAAVVYNSCLAVQEAGDQHKAMWQIMNDTGLADWPLVAEEEQRRRGNLNWTDALMTVGIKPFFRLDVGRDHTDLSSYVIQLDQIGFFGVGRNQLIYPNGRNNEPIIAAYKKLIAVAATFMNPNITELQAKMLANDLVDFEGRLANLTTPPEERRNVLALTHRTSVGELQRNFSDFPLLDFLNKEFKVINVTLNENEPLETTALDYYAKLAAFIKKAEPTTIFNYLGFKVMSSWGHYASQDIRNASLELQKAVGGVTSQGPRWEYCVPLLIEHMQEVTGYLYVTQKFNKETKLEVEKIVNVLKEVFNDTLQKSTWMDADTKREATVKLEKMISKIGYPDWLLNTTGLMEFSKYIPKLEHDTPFVLIWKSVRDNNWKLLLENLRQPYDPEKVWIVSAAVLNAFYNRYTNEMVYPAGILQGVFYEHGLPWSMNFGAFGNVAGHELTHGFDDMGSQYDAEGRLRQWWSKATWEEFEKKAECFVQQYGRIHDKQAGMTLNGRNTLGENIADNGGIRSAFKAYKKMLKEEFMGKDTRLRGLEELPGEKLFFIAGAMMQCTLYRTEVLRAYIQYDNHSPFKYRVNMPMTNFPEFASVFNCRAQSGMNPNRNETCALW